ncbi:MAG: histidine phosphatase family protein [Acidimicrobiia bacterium]|nr:histidine phosphatase family protein [Acidimicrobiia bacterium]
MAFYVVRHGQTEANASGLLLGRANPQLDDVGRRQARAIGGALPAGALVVSSPLDRCRQTTEHLAEIAQPREVHLDDRLLELDYGDLDLTPVSDVPSETWRAWQADPDFRPPNGETLTELAARVHDCLEDFWPEAAAGEVVVVTHVSPIKAAVAWALGVPIDISWRCHVGQASITKIASGSKGPSLHWFNSTVHLDRQP